MHNLKKYLVVVGSLFFLMFISCDRPWSYNNPFDPKSDLEPKDWRPKSLEAVVLSDSKLQLNWQQAIVLIDGFNIYRKENNDAYQFLARADTLDRFWLDTALNINVIYSYTIEATAGDNVSEQDTVENLQTAFPRVEELYVQSVNDTAVLIGWAHDYEEEEEYVIERKVSAAAYDIIGNAAKDVFTYADTGRSAGTYRYRIKVYSEYNESEYSPELVFMNIPSSLNTQVLDDRHIRLSWRDTESYISGFIIERSVDSQGYTVLDTAARSVRTYDDDSLTVGVVYSYRIKKYYREYVSDYSKLISESTYFERPANLTATPINDQSIKLIWQHDCSYESGYRIERRTGTNSFEQIGTTGADVLNYTDSGLTINTDYEYRVCAFTDLNVSDYSELTTATTSLISPSNLTATPINDQRIKLTWDHNCSYESGYIIERKSGSGNFVEIGQTDSNVLTYTDANVVQDIEYSYRVSAFTELNKSDYSEIVQIIISSQVALWTGTWKVTSTSNTYDSFDLRNDETLKFSNANFDGTIVSGDVEMVSNYHGKVTGTFEYNPTGGTLIMDYSSSPYDESYNGVTINSTTLYFKNNDYNFTLTKQ